MRLLNILIILACLMGGYWLVSSIMGPGMDPNRNKKPDDKPGGKVGGNASGDSGDPGAGARAHEHDWHLILDVPANASRREVDAAYKRRLAKAESSGDSFESIRIRRAYEAALRHAKS
ncbi:MAG: hypothetical protein ABI645_01975 [Pseudomonadota bacterium]